MNPNTPNQPKAPNQDYPTRYESSYQADLRREVAAINTELRKSLTPLGKELDSEVKAEEKANEDGRKDSITIDSLISQMMFVISSMRDDVVSATSDSYVRPEELTDLASDTANFSALAVSKQVEAMGMANAINVLSNESLTVGLVDYWATKNSRLIVSLKTTYLDKVAKAVQTTISDGYSWQSLSKALTERWGVSRSHADLIAVDQIGTLNGQITRKRQSELGISEFVWSTSDDGRVRPDHEAIDGDKLTWSEGHPTEGFPGEPIRCRCSAIPVLP